jgi:hypothetical protein
MTVVAAVIERACTPLWCAGRAEALAVGVAEEPRCVCDLCSKVWHHLPCRYGALKSLGEKKTAHNEYVQQRKKEEAEEARQRRMQVRWSSGSSGQCHGSFVVGFALGFRNSSLRT